MRKKIELDELLLKEMYNKGYTMQEIANKLETTKRVVHLRMQEYNIPRREMKGKNHGSWKGGKVKKCGYWAIWNPTHPRANNCGYVKEHILVMEKKLNRQIKKNEIIHHIDSNKLNNNPNNLYICSNSEHLKAERSIRKLIRGLIDDDIIYFDKNLGIYKRKGEI